MASNLKYNFLIVEDNDTMREGIVRVVEKMGHKAVNTPDAEQAIEQLSQTKFDLLISDYKLPGMTGIDLLEKAKQNSPETEALLITAYGSIELAVEAMKKGAADFITKPFSPEELTLKVKLILERISATF